MKGIFNVMIEIDYSELLEKGDMSTLSMFTGGQDTTGIINAHMQGIAFELGTLLKDKPMVKYGLEGKIVDPSKKEEGTSNQDGLVQEVGKPAEDVEQPNTATEFVEEPEDTIEDIHALAEVLDGHSIEEPVEETPLTMEYVDLLNKDIDDVSMNKGIPHTVVINEDINQLLREKFNVPEGESINKYKGFSVDIEGMEELYEIKYKDYENGNGESFVRMRD